MTKKQSMNGSKPPSNGLLHSNVGPDPLDRAQAAIEDGVKATRELDAYDDYEEPTGRHEVTVNLVNPPTPPQPSAPDIQVSQPSPGVIAVVTNLTGKVPPLGATIVLSLAIVAFAAYHIVKMATGH